MHPRPTGETARPVGPRSRRTEGRYQPDPRSILSGHLGTHPESGPSAAGRGRRNSFVPTRLSRRPEGLRNRPSREKSCRFWNKPDPAGVIRPYPFYRPPGGDSARSATRRIVHGRCRTPATRFVVTDGVGTRSRQGEITARALPGPRRSGKHGGLMAKRMILMLVAVAVFLVGIAAVKTRQIQKGMKQNASFQPPPEAVTTIVAKQERWPETLTAVGSAVAVH